MGNSSKIVLSLCDRTGNMVRPWAEGGYECWCVDIQHKKGYHREGNIMYIGADVHTWKLPRREYAMVFAFPPCTHLAVSGARWWRGKGLKSLAGSILLVSRCAEICAESGAPWMLENPVGVLSTHWREPDFRFNPCDFGGYMNPPGDHYTKKTCVWCSDDFVVPDMKRVPATEGSRMHFMAPGPERADLRAETPMGFAIAVYQANRHKCGKK